MRFDLYDWRKFHFSTTFASLTKAQQKPWEVTVPQRDGVDSEGVEIDFEAPDGSSRSLKIEVENGVLKIHCYDHKHEEPALTVFLDRAETHIRLGDMRERIYKIHRDQSVALDSGRCDAFQPENKSP